ncbi:MAG: hypothetical protein F6K40_26940 [Okeania sp. SIO3I5]|uniref:hypothetical protein n=1 Tax=Okeania sp. SIO3I5 TaxID=2607805 RepID=UPI0013B82DD9|nr:hypothetical protein [Okeania sp. SIO3I5]NEQ39691.1 hypothetical protein [Okeania sp. SIO3I5]
MPFSNYKNIATVAQEFQIKYILSDFINELEFTVPQSFRAELELLFTDGVVDNSEDAICENLIYPVLKEVWKMYRKKLTLWSHQTLTYDENLSGKPDYIVAKRHPLTTIIFDKPYFLLVEAKQDNFNEGWGQCLAELVAVQKINKDLEQTIFGIVSNGQVWQFGKLKGDIFTRNIISYNIGDLDRLFSVVNYVFQECLLQLENHKNSL